MGRIGKRLSRGPGKCSSLARPVAVAAVVAVAARVTVVSVATVTVIIAGIEHSDRGEMGL